MLVLGKVCTTDTDVDKLTGVVMLIEGYDVDVAQVVFVLEDRGITDFEVDMVISVILLTEEYDVDMTEETLVLELLVDLDTP